VFYSEDGLKGKLGKATPIEKGSNIPSAIDECHVAFHVALDWDESIGLPGAFIIKNNHRNEFYLKTLTLEDVSNHGKIHFVCNSWIYPARRYKYDRVFFSNKTYLPGDTPTALQPYREEELKNLRGNGSGSGMLKEWDRVYDYAYYNDLGTPEKGLDYERPVLGGTKEFPYPRRGKTGRAPNKKGILIFKQCLIAAICPQLTKKILYFWMWIDLNQNLSIG
jgi:linoleate 9S-lipoxygenase